MIKTINVDIAVLGSGPGGYTAAFRAADMGYNVVMIEKYDNIGGVCLNVGCIPSKSLLHTAKLIDEFNEYEKYGLEASNLSFNKEKIINSKDKIVSQLTSGLKHLAKLRKVEIIHGYGYFKSEHLIEVKLTDTTILNINFKFCIIAVGSSAVKLPFIPKHPKILNSTTALNIPHIPNKLLVIGGGIIGLEMATIYRALGSKVDIIELNAQLMPGFDKDISNIYKNWILKKGYNVYLESKVQAVSIINDEFYVNCKNINTSEIVERQYDTLLVAVGRVPNGKTINAENAGIVVTDNGFITVDKQLRTNIPHIFAIGDVIGQPMLAHKAVKEGTTVIDIISGKNYYFEPKCIPSVAYTDPEIAQVGLTELQAKTLGINYGIGSFPWAANGRSLSIGRSEGLTKILIDKSTNKIIGCSIIGTNAGELITELTLAIEMSCDIKDLSLIIHPHPTLSETIGIAAEVFEGTATDILNK
jgi:dihydrolipoamide dehydrogenase